MDCFYAGRLSGTKGVVWQLTAIDVHSSFAWAELVSRPRGTPTAPTRAASPAAASPPKSSTVPAK
jgi:hypothetical protein